MHYLEDVEPNRTSEVELEVYDGPVPILHLDNLVAVLPVDHPVLGELQGIVHAERGALPLVLYLVTGEPETPDLKRTALEQWNICIFSVG